MNICSRLIAALLSLPLSVVSAATPAEPLGNVDKIAAGGDNACAVDNDGFVACWGRNHGGQLGRDAGEERRLATRVDVVRTPIASVAVGTYHACAVTSLGGALCWGSPFSAGLGDGGYSPSVTPVPVVGLQANVAAVGVGDSHSCALTITGAVKCWGNDSYGQLGDDTTLMNSNVPVDVAGLDSGVLQLSVGARHSCAVTASHGAVCWGYNGFGVLGTGGLGRTPVSVSGLGSGVEAVFAGSRHSCAILSDRTVQCWGSNLFGAVAPSSEPWNTYPTAVQGVSNVESMALGTSFSCALITGGDVKCWGWNGDGQLGIGGSSATNGVVDMTGLSGPAVAIAAGYNHVCARFETGQVECVGGNVYGQLGNETPRPMSSTPVAVSGFVSGAKDVSSGGSHSCAVSATGGVKCWGWGGYGQLGNGASIGSASPVDVTGLDSGYKAVAAGGEMSCALSDLGAVKCWGTLGITAEGQELRSNMPVGVVGLSANVEAISVGDVHGCARLSSGEVRCWGYDFSVPDPTIVPPESAQVSGFASDALAVSAGDVHSCAIAGNGQASCWGLSNEGALGSNVSVSSATPVPVSDLASNIVEIETGFLYSCALDADGNVFCWGDRTDGKLGVPFTGTTPNYMPMPVTQLGGGNLQVSAGGYHTCVRSPASGVKCFGANERGQLGNGGFIGGDAAVNVIGQTSDIQKVSNGFRHTCSLSNAGAVTCWGSNSEGQIGDSVEPGFKALPVTVLAAPTPLFISGFE